MSTLTFTKYVSKVVKVSKNEVGSIYVLKLYFLFGIFINKFCNTVNFLFSF